MGGGGKGGGIVSAWVLIPCKQTITQQFFCPLALKNLASPPGRQKP